MEIFKDITGYEGIYRVSNYGRVIGLDREGTNGKGKRMFKGVEIRGSNDGQGYRGCFLSKNGKPSRKMIHKLVAIHFIDNPENKPCVNHKNGIKNDNRVENLEWATHRENSIHAINTGLYKNRPKEKLITAEKIKEIVSLSEQGNNQFVIADKFGVSQSVISRVLSLKRGYANVV